ncbi:MAG: DUF5069 domain-containing protein [Thermoanaerobaculia bacterium]|nr:DUF5069 domain-containing protein [Thermoanaerobaculia bacterium]
MSGVRSGLAELRAAGSYLRGLRPFLRGRVDARGAGARLAHRLADRERAFAQTLVAAVFRNPASPYRRLFDWAGISPRDVADRLAADGVETTLEWLHDAGVHVSLEEFKGRRPIVRPGFELDVRAEDFDNPASARHYEARTGGSGGPARRIRAGLDLLDYESLHHAAFYRAAGGLGRPFALWLPAPPGAVGLKNALIGARLGMAVERWFSQSRPAGAPARHRLFTWTTLAAARALGRPIARPEETPATAAGDVARWLADRRAQGSPAVLATTPSAAVRTCATATRERLDIAGTLFVVVGEPFTATRAGVVAAAGCAAASHYAMVEAGLIGVACGAPNAADDVHLAADKIATIQRPRTVGARDVTVQALLHTTLLTASPQMMLNVESGDYGELEDRQCGCDVLPAAFRRHLRGIRSYEKLTGEGMHFLGVDLLHLLDDLLPARFGGNGTDYQLIEREDAGGRTLVTLVVAPSLGELATDDVAHATLEFLRARGVGQRLMAEVWQNAGTLQVVRAEPQATTAGKIQPLLRKSA